MVTTPDMITLLDAETGAPVTADAMRYGIRVVALAYPVRRPMAHAQGPGTGRPALFRLRPRLPALHSGRRAVVGPYLPFAPPFRASVRRRSSPLLPGVRPYDIHMFCSACARAVDPPPYGGCSYGKTVDISRSRRRPLKRSFKKAIRGSRAGAAALFGLRGTPLLPRKIPCAFPARGKKFPASPDTSFRKRKREKSKRAVKSLKEADRDEFGADRFPFAGRP